MDLADKYLEIIGKRKLYPSLNNYSAFIQGSEYNIFRYYEKWYDGKMRLDHFTYMKEGFSQVWLPEDDFIFAVGFAFHEYLTDQKRFQRRVDFMNESIKKIDKIYAEFTYEKIGKSDLLALLPLIDQVRDIIWDANSAAAFTIIMDKAMCLELIEKESYPLTPDELEKIWDKSVEPAFESFDRSQAFDFLDQTKNGKSWDEIVEMCQYFLTDYYSAHTLSDIERFIKEHYSNYIGDTKLAGEALSKEVAEVENVVKSHEAWLNTLPEKEQTIARYLQIVMKVRDKRKNFFAKGLTVIYRIAERMFAEEGIDRSFIPFYTMRELKKGSDYLRSVKKDLEERKKGFQWLIPCEGDPQGLNIDIDPGTEKLNTYFKKSHESGQGSESLRGQTAFKGKVRGKVRIVLNMNSNHGFKEGEILVAGMTRPEYVPLMKKASAIITDEGGITCHAAIVSRELKKPCIIGTKIATRVLKDGDMVEVDAEKGIVRIIKS